MPPGLIYRTPNFLLSQFKMKEKPTYVLLRRSWLSHIQEAYLYFKDVIVNVGVKTSIYNTNPNMYPLAFQQC